jgi:hypothetical protein
MAGKTQSPHSTPATVVAVAVDAAHELVYAQEELAPLSTTIFPWDHDPGGERRDPSTTTAATAWYLPGRFVATLLACGAMVAAVSLALYFGLAASDSRVPTPAAFFPNPTTPPISSTSPTAMVTADANLARRATVLTSYINNITLSNQIIAANGTSPESRALAWMIANDTTLETSVVIRQDNPPIGRNALGFRIQQLYPLLVMWFQQTATEQWAITTGWLVDPNKCTWYGITCAATHVHYNDDDLVQTDDLVDAVENAVVHISFTQLAGSYVGILPVDIGLLTNLQRFEIQDTYAGYAGGGTNYLKESLPDSVGRWTALSHFDVRGNFGLMGTLPDSIGQWVALMYFDISDDGLTGTLPGSMDQWHALTYFDASTNFVLTGTIPRYMGNWTALTYFDISRNGLTGAFPSSIGQWTALSYFAASANGLNGTLPDSMGRWSSLTYFDASSNYLTGTLPYSIGQWTSLAYFGMYDDKLNGTLPESIGKWTALTFFSVGLNLLNGTIPMAVGNWSLMEQADFSGNALVGSIRCPKAFANILIPAPICYR